MNFKKPKFWDLKKPNLLSYLLLPFTIFLRINNFLLKLKSKRKSKEIKTICVIKHKSSCGNVGHVPRANVPFPRATLEQVAHV